MATPKDEIKETRQGEQGDVRSADIESVSHCSLFTVRSLNE